MEGSREGSTTLKLFQIPREQHTGLPSALAVEAPSPPKPPGRPPAAYRERSGRSSPAVVAVLWKKKTKPHRWVARQPAAPSPAPSPVPGSVSLSHHRRWRRGEGGEAGPRLSARRPSRPSRSLPPRKRPPPSLTPCTWKPSAPPSGTWELEPSPMPTTAGRDGDAQAAAAAATSITLAPLPQRRASQA